MATEDNLILYAGQYQNLDDARDDFEVIKELHKEKFVGRYEAALYTKEESGKVKIVDTDETSRAHGAEGGAVIGAVLGLIFPPSLLLLAAGGAGVGAIIGHVHNGMPRSDIKELGEMLDEGEAGILYIGEATMEKGVEKQMKKASKVLRKEIKEETREMKRYMKEAA